MTKTEENLGAVARRARFACRPAAKPLEKFGDNADAQRQAVQDLEMA
jgi:hypothetical protein